MPFLALFITVSSCHPNLPWKVRGKKLQMTVRTAARLFPGEVPEKFTVNPSASDDGSSSGYDGASVAYVAVPIQEETKRRLRVTRGNNISCSKIKYVKLNITWNLRVLLHLAASTPSKAMSIINSFVIGGTLEGVSRILAGTDYWLQLQGHVHRELLCLLSSWLEYLEKKKQ